MFILNPGKHDKSDKSDCFTCLIPIMIAAVEKADSELEFESVRSTLSSNIFDQYDLTSQEEPWRIWMEDKVSPTNLFSQLDPI